MKKLTNIITLAIAFAILLSVTCVSIFANSETETLEEIYANQLKPDGALNYFAYTDATKNFGVTSSLGNKKPSSSSVKVTENGNTYMSMQFLPGGTFDKEGGGYRNLIVGGSSGKVTSYGLVFNGDIKWIYY